MSWSCGLVKFVTIVSNQTRLQMIRHFCGKKLSDQDQFEKTHFFNRSEKETIDIKRARLLYQSRKRGMLENDLLLATFAQKYLNTMSPNELEMYDKMINTVSNEWDLYHWAVGKKEIPEEYRNSIMDKYCQHVRNMEREKRLRQPDL